MSIIEQIKNEIERRIEAHHTHGHFCAEHEFRDVLSFLSTLESEKPNDRVVEGEVILNGHGLLVDVTKWGDGYKLKVIIKEN